jgi:threonine/homoserine/homoserine lactone efflux protein
MNILLQGFIIGFSIAAPVGPIGVLCIRRTLVGGRASGIASGMGAATADAIFGSIAGFGITFLSTFMISQQNWIRLIGGLFLCYLGVKTLLSQPAEQAANADGSGLVGAYASTLVLTLTNPASIVLFAAIFAGLGIANGVGSYNAARMLVAGVFLGSAVWWNLLSVGVSLFRTRLNTTALRWVNRISGVIIGGFGLAALASLVMNG